MLPEQFEILIAEKSDKKAIKRFYKQQGFNAGFLGNDSVYLVKQAEQIKACMIISVINQQAFLHGLVVCASARKRGLAIKLLNKAKDTFSELICFAEESLTGFYQKQGFKLGKANILKDKLLMRYQSYIRHKTGLVIFHYHNC
jgi:GNAT superfamily N-acetyltransferase